MPPVHNNDQNCFKWLYNYIVLFHNKFLRLIYNKDCIENEGDNNDNDDDAFPLLKGFDDRVYLFPVTEFNVDDYVTQASIELEKCKKNCSSIEDQNLYHEYRQKLNESISSIKRNKQLRDIGLSSEALSVVCNVNMDNIKRLAKLKNSTKIMSLNNDDVNNDNYGDTPVIMVDDTDTGIKNEKDYVYASKEKLSIAH